MLSTHLGLSKAEFGVDLATIGTGTVVHGEEIFKLTLISAGYKINLVDVDFTDVGYTPIDGSCATATSDNNITHGERDVRDGERDPNCSSAQTALFSVTKNMAFLFFEKKKNIVSD